MEKLTTGAAAKRLGISQSRLGVLIRGGRIRAERDPIFGYWLITVAELRRFKKIPRKDGRPRQKT